MSPALPRYKRSLHLTRNGFKEANKKKRKLKMNHANQMVSQSIQCPVPPRFTKFNDLFGQSLPLG